MNLFRILFLLIPVILSSQEAPIPIGVIGLSHSHVHWVFNSESRGDITIAGIVEQDQNLIERYCKQYDFPRSRVYASMEELFLSHEVQGVAAFGNIYDHLSIVEVCAPRGIHVMVEKPLAVSLEHAKQMSNLAEEFNIHLITNYETTWYPTNHKAFSMLREERSIGDLRKIIVRDGHKGPKKIGIDPEFLAWLTDPRLNGAGALMDFGCYGANLCTWLMNNQKPNRVTAITHQQQYENNPLVDDEAVIILQYDTVVAIIQASWNWPIGRKDMELYGLNGALYADNRNDLRLRISEGYDGFEEQVMHLEERKAPLDDPFAYFAGVIKGTIEVNPLDLSSIENNLVVMEILDAAMRSATSGKTVEIR